MKDIERHETATMSLMLLRAAFDTWPAVADSLGIPNVHIYDALNNKHLSPTLDRALVKAGYLEPKPTRTRFAADVSRQLRDDICDRARMLELTNGEMLARMWQIYILHDVEEYNG